MALDFFTTSTPYHIERVFLIVFYAGLVSTFTYSIAKRVMRARKDNLSAVVSAGSVKDKLRISGFLASLLLLVASIDYQAFFGIYSFWFVTMLSDVSCALIVVSYMVAMIIMRFQSLESTFDLIGRFRRMAYWGAPVAYVLVYLVIDILGFLNIFLYYRSAVRAINISAGILVLGIYSHLKRKSQRDLIKEEIRYALSENDMVVPGFITEKAMFEQDKRLVLFFKKTILMFGVLLLSSSILGIVVLSMKLSDSYIYEYASSIANSLLLVALLANFVHYSY